MGNNVSTEYEESDIWWLPPHLHTTNNEVEKICKSTQTSSENTENNLNSNEDSSVNTHTVQNEIKIKQFKSDLEKKHLARREAIAERSREILFLREELVKYKKENEQLKDLLKYNNEYTEEISEQNIDEIKIELQQLRHENEELQKKITQLNEELNKTDEISKQNQELRKSIAETQKDLQAVNAQVSEFEKEKHDYQSHVIALKDVIRVSKRLLEIRENQLQELKTKIADIETSLAEKEVSMMSQNLKDEYERQLENIRNLRALYEQRQAATKAERDLMASQLTDAKNNLENEQKKNGEFQERIGELENNVSDKYDEIKSLESQLGLAKAEFRGLETEMSAINQLFSQILFGFNNCQEIDFDKLIKLLEENHDLLTNIVVNEESEATSYVLPKVLLDLVNQVNEENKSSNVTGTEESVSQSYNKTETITHVQPDPQNCNIINSAEEIVSKLPKVWRVLTELLRQQCGQQQVDIKQEDTDPCYKSVETPKGPKLVLSVSKTFIRLKNLIMEKKSLEKEMTHLKQLNTHLEIRLQDQEKRLETVSSELSKTWHVVGRMQKQHQQLHTHEKILRYELAQKRKMLTELKEELEYCREKWEQAREKNSNTEEEWKKLRTEFASRKTVIDEFNNSAESGYSDERECSSDEEYNIDKRNKKLMNKTTINEQNSDTDDNEETKDNNEQVGIQMSEDTEKNNECEEIGHSTAQKTDFEIESQSNVSPESLDVIDDANVLEVDCASASYSENTLEETPSTSSTSVEEISQDERLKRREERLKRLEEQCKQLVNKVTNTTNRSTEIYNKLETLHEQYGNDSSKEKSNKGNPD